MNTLICQLLLLFIVSQKSPVLAQGERFNLPAAPISKATHDFISTTIYTYVDDKKVVWTAPTGTVTDGASIPQICMSFIGPPLGDHYTGAALIHDAYCGEANHGHLNYQSASWRAVHRMFYDACLAGGTPQLQAQIMYAAVWMYGPRWLYPKYIQYASGSDRNVGVSEITITEYNTEGEKEINRLDVESINQTLKIQQFKEIINYIKDNKLDLDNLDSMMESATYRLKTNNILVFPDKNTK